MWFEILRDFTDYRDYMGLSSMVCLCKWSLLGLISYNLDGSVTGYSLQDLTGISPMICTHRMLTDPSVSPSREPQRRLNNAMREVVKKEVIKVLHAEIIYPMLHSEWLSPVQVVPKKDGMTVVTNEKNELILQRTVTGWQMCIDYRKLNKATKKDHFPLPFIDEMLERLANHSFF